MQLQNQLEEERAEHEARSAKALMALKDQKQQILVLVNSLKEEEKENNHLKQELETLATVKQTVNQVIVCIYEFLIVRMRMKS